MQKPKKFRLSPKKSKFGLCKEETFLHTICKSQNLIVCKTQAQMIAEAPEDVGSSRAKVAGGATAAAAGAGAPMFGVTFSFLMKFTNLCRFASGIAGGVTAPLLLLSYGQYKQINNAVLGQAQMHNFLPAWMLGHITVVQLTAMR